MLIAGLLLVTAIYKLAFPPMRIASLETIRVDGMERSYRLVVPRRWQRSESVPVVFAFHGTGDKPGAMPRYSKLDRLAVKHRFLLVYPHALHGMWKVIQPEGQGIDDNADVRYFDVLLQQLDERFNIDRGRVYLAGMSNGATFAQLLANGRAEQIAAVAAHSGPLQTPLESSMADNVAPVLLVVGSRDAETTIEAMRKSAKEYRRARHLVELIVIEGLGHRWAASYNEPIWAFLSSYAKR